VIFSIRQPGRYETRQNGHDWRLYRNGQRVAEVTSGFMFIDFSMIREATSCQLM